MKSLQGIGWKTWKIVEKGEGIRREGDRWEYVPYNLFDAMSAILKSVNLALAFLLELAMLAAYAYWGFQAGTSIIMKVVLGIGDPL